METPTTCVCGNDFDGDNLCMVSACQWEGLEPLKSRAPSASYGVECDTCGAGSEDPCRSIKSHKLTDTHQARINAWWDKHGIHE